MEITSVDRELAASARHKRQSGQKCTRDEFNALRRVEAQEREQERDRLLTKIPQKVWRRWSGRQTKTLKEQAESYGIAFGDAEIDLPKVVQQLHDFLADNKHKLASDNAAEPTPADRIRDERARLLQLERLAKERQVLPAEEIKGALDIASAALRKAGDVLQRRYGPQAQEVLNEAIDEAIRQINELVSDPTDADR